MKRWLAVAAVLWSATAIAGDWRDGLVPLKPGKFPLPRPQTATYRFGWGAVSAAQAQIEFSVQKKGQLQLQLNASTTGAVRALWQMDSEYISRCSRALAPISLQQTERYRNETEKTKAEFTPEQVVRLAEREPPNATPAKSKRFKFPHLVDMHTALLQVRSQTLHDGDRYTLVVYPARAAYLAKVEVLGREKIEVGGKTYEAVKLGLSLQYISKNLELEPHKKFKNAAIWLSDDEDRLLLKIKSEVFVGSVWMELQSVKFAADKSKVSESKSPAKRAARKPAAPRE